MKKDEGAVAFFALALMIALIVPSVMWKGYVLSIMWGWFIVPAFALPPLKLGIAIGISAIIAFVVPSTDCKKSDSDDGISAIALKGILQAFAKPALFLLFGWIVKSWM